MRYIGIPDLPYSAETMENLMIAIINLRDPLGRSIAVLPRIIEFSDKPFIELHAQKGGVT